jgi:NADPH:quinone reductase-like Zn-dependent oxidoreductase
VIVTQQQDLTKEVMRVTAGKGARFAFDPVAGQGVEALTTAMGDGGTIFLYGGSGASGDSEVDRRPRTRPVAI